MSVSRMGRVRPVNALVGPKLILARLFMFSREDLQGDRVVLPKFSCHSISREYHVWGVDILQVPGKPDRRGCPKPQFPEDLVPVGGKDVSNVDWAVVAFPELVELLFLEPMRRGNDLKTSRWKLQRSQWSSAEEAPCPFQQRCHGRVPGAPAGFCGGGGAVSRKRENERSPLDERPFVKVRGRHATQVIQQDTQLHISALPRNNS